LQIKIVLVEAAEKVSSLFQIYFPLLYLALYGWELPRQSISLPVLLILGILIIRKGANLGVGMLYVVAGILLLSILLFFLGEGTSETVAGEHFSSNFGFSNRESFFTVFAICFPAFTGMTAGVGLSGDFKNPGKSLPMGTMLATFLGMIIYYFRPPGLEKRKDKNIQYLCARACT
jgi:amino acid transporter